MEKSEYQNHVSTTVNHFYEKFFLQWRCLQSSIRGFEENAVSKRVKHSVKNETRKAGIPVHRLHGKKSIIFTAFFLQLLIK